MACTSQSALDYVKHAKPHLISGLKDLSVILENLNQKGVLGDEEVSNIKAEKTDEDKRRTTLISVIKKGEAACYELLKIIDRTRKRTLEKLLLPPEKNSDASTEKNKFDLHHWISCFSFKEETQVDTNYLQGPRSCHKYQEMLKSNAKEKSNEFWAASKNWFEGNKTPDLSYSSLILDTEQSVCPSKIKKLKKRKSKLSRPKKLRTYIPEEKPTISPSELLKTDKNILLVGKPGIGKTALTHEMLRLWAERESKELDYMFYFDMRETAQIVNAKNLEELLFSFYCGPDEGKDAVLQDIQSHSDNVTIIFDGLTDISSPVVTKILKNKLLPLAKIIITCRPDDEDTKFFSGNFDRVEVKGFSEQTIKTYLSATLGEDQTKVLSSVELVTLCHVPMYALMMAVCFSSKDAPQPCTITEIYINIVRYCLQINSRTKNQKLNFFIKTKREEILSLAEAAFLSTQQKTVNLTDLTCDDSCVLSFLKPLLIKEAVTETITTYAFLHYTVQEFFAALWLLKNPDKIRDVFQQCLTEEKKHMKHLIPFMCRLLNEKSPSLMKHLIPDQDLKNTSNWFFKELINTFLPHLCEQEAADTEGSGLHVHILFVCQCLYESQSPEACVYLLDKLDYHLDLSGDSLDPYPCCAVAYVVTQSKERKIRLNLEDVIISEQGMRQLFGCFENVQWSDSLARQLWELFLISEEQMDFVTLLSLDGNHLHLPTQGEKQLYERAVEVIQRMPTKVNVCLYWDNETPPCHSQCESLLKAFPFISSVSFRGPVSWSQEKYHGTLEREQKRLFMDLCLKAALHDGPNFYNVVKTLLPLFPVKTDLDNIFLDLFQYVNSKEFLGDFQGLRPFFQSAPAVWSINLSERKTSILLEVLKLQPEKKQVELTGCSHEESEVRSFLQCLPYISQLSVIPQLSEPSEETRFLGNLFCAAAEREQQTGEKILELLSSVCRYKTFPLTEIWCDFLFDLYSHVKDYEIKTGLSVLPSLQSVSQSAPAVWSINLSERKTSILLEVLKLQPEKKQVELTGCSHEKSEVLSFLQCLPYISQLSFSPSFLLSSQTDLTWEEAEREQQPEEKILELLISVCRHGTFPFNERCSCADCDFLLDLFSHVKDCEAKTGLSVLPSLQSVFSAPAVWFINLSERKTSILLEVLKLQPEKKQVELTGCSHEKSEVRSFLQCLPYISQLRLSIDMSLLLFQWVRRGRVVCPLAVEELSLVPKKARPSQRVMLRAVSSLASLLRHWTVGRLDLTESCIPAQGLITLLLHDGPLTVKLSEESFQQLLCLLHEIQDKDLTLSFFSKVGGDLTSCCLNWELLHYLLQQASAQTITVNLRKNLFLQEETTRLLPFLDRIVFKRPSPSFVMSSIRELYRAHDSHAVPSLLRSLGHVINLSSRELDSVDCAALIFILKHGDRVKLNLLWTSIPAEGAESILFMLDNVSHLSVDRNQLLRFIHCCAACDVQQEAASGLLRTLQHSLDLSCSSCVELPEEHQPEPLSLTADDCRAVSTILTHSSQDTQLDLRDCEVEDSVLDLLFPVLHRVRLRVSKTVLLQLLSLVPVNSERDTVRRAVSLCRALGGELDLSHSTLDQRACGSLVQMLDSCEGLTELDLSHCQLTDQLLLPLITHLHKVQVLDLSHNQITDASTDVLLQLLSINPSIDCVRLYSNNIVHRAAFKEHKQCEI
uniref:Si:ch211-108d22.2 n=1 Tax=Haplochromis burtoni TaxID=8153 RepID=A0A3Q2VEX0_HAPBU